MTDGTDQVCVRLPTVALARLDEFVEVEGGTRAEVASRLLVNVLADLETGTMAGKETYALLDLDENLTGP